MRLEPLICMPAAWTSVFSQFAVHIFEGRITLDDIDLMQRVGERWTREHPGQRVELSIILPSETRMTYQEQALMARVIKLGESHRVASATVILAEGVIASLQRSALMGMMMVVPPPHPAKVFAALEDAAKWLHPYVKHVCTPSLELADLSDSLEAHVAQFRGRPSLKPVQVG